MICHQSSCLGKKFQKLPLLTRIQLKQVQDTTIKIQIAIYKDVIVFQIGNDVEPCSRTEREVDDTGEYTYVTESLMDTSRKKVGLIWSPGWNGVSKVTKNTTTRYYADRDINSSDCNVKYY